MKNDLEKLANIIKNSRLSDAERNSAETILKRLSIENKYEESTAEHAFLSVISHEIRTPLNTIIGFLKLLSNTALASLQKKYIHNIKISSDNLLKLLDDVLDVTKIETGQMELFESETDFDELIYECINSVSGSVVADVEVLVELEEINHMLVTDPGKLKQIVTHILSIASKTTKKGQVKVSLNQIDNPKPKEGYTSLQFVVSDTGSGFTDDEIQNIYKPFSQNTKSELIGTNLGFYLVHSIAPLINGHFSIKSTKNKGTSSTLNITLKNGKPRQKDSRLDKKNILLCCKNLLKPSDTKKLASTGVNIIIPPGPDKFKELINFSVSLKEPLSFAVLDLEKMHNKGEHLSAILKEFHKDICILGIIPEGSGPQPFLDEFISKPFLYSKLAEKLVNCVTGTYKKKKHTLNASNLKVLLAEDVELNAMLAVELFKSYWGIDIEVAENGQIVLDKVKNNHVYDIIFMDIQMPVMDGLTAVEKLREQGINTPVYALSANVFAKDIKKSLEKGMNGYIKKPLVIEDIENVINEILGHSSVTKQIEPATTPLPSKQENLKERIAHYFAQMFPEKDKVDKLLTMCIDNIRKLKDQILSDFKKKDVENSLKGIHSLKGVLLNSGLSEQAEYIIIIEKNLKKSRHIDSVKQDIDLFFENIQSLTG